MEVQFAQPPETTPDFGTPFVWATTDQIGGDVKYVFLAIQSDDYRTDPAAPRA